MNGMRVVATQGDEAEEFGTDDVRMASRRRTVGRQFTGRALTGALQQLLFSRMQLTGFTSEPQVRKVSAAGLRRDGVIGMRQSKASLPSTV